MILCSEAGVCEVAVDIAPVAQASVVEKFEFICDDEWHYLVCKAFFEHYESAYTSVAILEWVNAFKLAVKVYDIFQSLVLDCVVCG